MASILIVEDNRVTAEQIKRRFGQAGHQCTVENTGASVLDKVKQETPDMILLDVMLPGTSGFEICRKIRRDPEIYTVPIMIVSAMNDDEEVFHGLAQGADDYVVKPFDMNNLLQRCEALLRANATGTDTDELTSLPGLEGTRREIQRRSSSRETFAIAHCELLGARELGRSLGMDARNKAIRHLGRALVGCSTELLDDEVFVGHMGGGHFIALMPVSGVKTFCDGVMKVWVKHSRSLGEKLGAKKDDTFGEAIFCVTLREPKDATTPQQVFETLSQIRHKALASKRAGVHLDRRALRVKAPKDGKKAGTGAKPKAAQE
ncbi:MAG: response regulator [bacterium]|nr:response regulator [bacterium]